MIPYLYFKSASLLTQLCLLIKMNSTVHRYNSFDKAVNELREMKIERRTMGPMGGNEEDDDEEYRYDSDGEFDEL